MNKRDRLKRKLEISKHRIYEVLFKTQFFDY